MSAEVPVMQVWTNTVEFFRNNPVLSMVNTIVGLVSLPVAIYFGVTSREYRDVVYMLEPVRTHLVQAGRPTELRVEFRGQPITSDVVAVQVSVWNQGRASVRPEHLLSRLEIHLDPPVPILEVSVTKRTRDVTEFVVAPTAELLQRGRVALSARILEHNDGGVVQLIYAGSPDVAAEVVGVIEGQGAPRRLVDTRSRNRGSEVSVKGSEGWGTKITIGVVLVGFVVMLVSSFNTARWAVRYARQRGGLNLRRGIVAIVLATLAVIVAAAVPVLVAIGFGLTVWPLLTAPAPPFGF
jgi:hypothetical protein